MNKLESQTVDDFEVGDLVRVEYIEEGEWTKYLHKLCRVKEIVSNRRSVSGEITSWLIVTGKKGQRGYMPQRLQIIRRAKNV